jgi:hypothetical protein
MRVELVQLDELSGKASKVYSVFIDSNSENELDRFIGNLTDESRRKKLAERFYQLQKDCRRGLREDFFKPEGGAADALVRIRDTGQVRVYGILFSKLCIILGGGGIKPKVVRTYQEVPELYDAVKLLKRIQDEILIRIKEGEFRFEDNGTIVGDHIFYIE